MNINKLDENSQVKIRDSKFDSNKAYNYGGVIYSSSKLTNTHVSFDNCQFNNNTSGKGIILKNYNL